MAWLDPAPVRDQQSDGTYRIRVSASYCVLDETHLARAMEPTDDGLHPEMYTGQVDTLVRYNDTPAAVKNRLATMLSKREDGSDVVWLFDSTGIL